MDPLKFHTRRFTHSQEQSPKKNEKTSITTTYLKHWRSPDPEPLFLEPPARFEYNQSMFCGIIEEMGVVQKVDRRPSGSVLSVLAQKTLADLSIGDSITTNGACLTVASFAENGFTVEISPETLRVTTLGELSVGEGVNLERSMRLMDRIGGHLVTGHVDAVGYIRERKSDGNASILSIEAPREVLRYCVVKGSVAVEGVSLTINSLSDRGFSVCIIPHTAKMTTLGIKGAGARVNLECDLIARYLERFLDRTQEEKRPKVDRGYLERHGLI